MGVGQNQSDATSAPEQSNDSQPWVLRAASEVYEFTKGIVKSAAEITGVDQAYTPIRTAKTVLEVGAPRLLPDWLPDLTISPLQSMKPEGKEPVKSSSVPKK